MIGGAPMTAPQETAGVIATTPASPTKDTIPNWLGVLYTLIFGGSFIHAVRSRSLHDFLVYAPRIAFGVALVTVFASVAATYEVPGKKPLRDWAGAVAIGLVMASGGGALLYGIGATGADAAQWLRVNATLETGPAHAAWTSILAIIGAVVAGVALFLARLFVRSLYGLTEATAGVYVAMLALTRSPASDLLNDPKLLMPLLTGSLYLVVRGLDNMFEGAGGQKRTDPIGARVWGWLKKTA
jgi:hypothetical protein